ncbi:hypothetical protein D046_0074A, partial [Vibrio parahaemolyticus V-223/04]|jgi:hypothetical protein
MNP